MEFPSAVELRCAVQNYAWGKRGAESEVFWLSRRCGHAAREVLDDDRQPFAELWMGTHPNGPSTIASAGTATTEPLADAIARAPVEILGARVVERFGSAGLPFLLKVLSVHQALSIQAHPDKALSEQLHRSRPDLYKDPNHKPEMALAISPFEALCGFRPPAQVLHYIRTVPELMEILVDSSDEMKRFIRASSFQQAGSGLNIRSNIRDAMSTSVSSSPSSSPTLQSMGAAGSGSRPPTLSLGGNSGSTSTASSTESSSTFLRTVYARLMRSPVEVFTPHLFQLMARLKSSLCGNSPSINMSLTDVDRLVLRLSEQYPGDIGCLAPYFLNYITMKPGEAVFLGANEPHAYLSGDCVECMATSDNVVRAGLTPKHKDVDTLLEMLTYRAVPAGSLLMESSPISFSVTTSDGRDALQNSSLLMHGSRYVVPVDEFQVCRYAIAQRSSMVPPTSENLPRLAEWRRLFVSEGPSIVLVHHGSLIFKSFAEAADAEESFSVESDPRAGEVFTGTIGSVWFIKHGMSVFVTAKSSSEPCVLYVASCSPSVFQTSS